ncbi:MAG TPA: S8 family serine peptidase [Acidimicrobiales bacterium]|nr:S8 family serine peptidase [Acidimicrobiales bacterium]
MVASAQPANDPLYGRQWGPQLVGAAEAWAWAPALRSPIIAVLDTGVDASNADLAGAVLPTKSFINDEGAGDPNGHGTAVAGVIAARGNNGIGVAGYCWTCRILPVRVLDGRASGSADTVAEAVRWAADNGASVINLSLVMAAAYAPLDAAISYARARGVVVVAAAGNGSGTTATYPAASVDAIGVVATDSRDQPYSWSDRGPWADVTAPGCAITTQVSGGFGESCGSSIAAPAVAGIVGLALAIYPSATADDIHAALAVSSKQLDGSARAGRVDAAALLISLQARLQERTPTTRIAGATRIETAIALSQAARRTSVHVVLATGGAAADALTASALAGHLDAPVLLTTGSQLEAIVMGEIRRLGAHTAWIVGGSGAVPDAVAGELRISGLSTTRLAGATRFETAAAVARAIGSDRAIVTDASSWRDAAAASGLAALEARPILLTDGVSVPDATRRALDGLGVTDVLAIGAPSVLRDEALAQIRRSGAVVTRVTGDAGSTTSTRIADLAIAAGAEATTPWLATGANWPDALTAGPAAAARGSVLVLVDGADVTDLSRTLAWLTARPLAPSRFVLVGGEASLPSVAMTWLTSASIAA